MFFKRQILVNDEPGRKTVLSGTVTSLTNSMRSQPRFGVDVRVWKGVRVGVSVRVGVTEGVRVGVRDMV